MAVPSAAGMKPPRPRRGREVRYAEVCAPGLAYCNRERPQVWERSLKIRYAGIDIACNGRLATC